MNKRVSPTVIGAFVLGAIALLVIGITVFGSGRLFTKTYEFVLYFQGSVNGLKVGAPVKFKGVEIGAVTNILLVLDPGLQVEGIPVVIEIDSEKLTGKGAPGTGIRDPKAFKKAIDSGLRAQLHTESFVTGVLYVELDYHPGTPARFVLPPGSRYREIPTMPTALEEAKDTASRIIAKLEELDINGLVAQASGAVQSIDRLANNPDLQAALKGANRLLNKPELASTIDSLDQAVSKLNRTVDAVQKLAASADAGLGALATDLKETSAAARDAVDQIRVTAASLQAFTEPDSPVTYELRRTLREVKGAARSLRLMADYLERNPSAVVFGKPEDEVQP